MIYLDYSANTPADERVLARFGSETGCKKTARAYYEAICAYFDTEPLPEAFETRHNG